MADKPKTPRERDPGHRFQAQHPRYGGRKKRTAQMARDLADELGCDPLAFMMKIITCEVFEQTIIDENGKEKRVKVAVDLATRLSACRDVAGYLYPKLSAQQVTGKDDGPLAVATLDVTQILANPALADAAQQLALMVVEQEISEERAGLPAPDYRFATPEYK
jgi:hypothetical protein